MDDLEMKGRRISGPRMKLSAEQRYSRIENAIADQSETIASLAKSVSILGKAVLSTIRKEKDEDKDEKEDKAVRKARTRKQFESEDAIGGDVSVDADRGRSEEDTINEPGLQDEKGAVEMKARVSKDDASSNFGEKDDDMPGNRSLVPDDKEKKPEEILIQGGPSDGPGAQVSAALKALVNDYLVEKGFVKKSVGPMLGSGAGGNALDVDKLFERARGMTFKEIAELRIAVGDLPGGLI